MDKNRIILFSIIVMATLVYANPFSTYKEHLGLNKASKDSFYVEFPVRDVSIVLGDTARVSITNVFNLFPDSLDWYPVASNPSIVYPEIHQDEITSDLYIELIANSIGRSDVTYTVFHHDSLEVIAASDTFIVTVDDPAYDWNEWGSAYSFQPEYCVGSGDSAWKAATHFSLSPEDSMHTFMLKQIEFGMALEENIEWKIVEFDEQPTDSLIIGDLVGSVLCTGSGPTYIENSYIEANFIDKCFPNDIALLRSSAVPYAL